MNCLSNVMQRGWLLFYVVGLLCQLLFPVGEATADSGSAAVEVEGYASIISGRKDLAREAALQNAFRRAVEQVVGVAIESKTVVRDSELLNDKIFSKSKGFIKTYKILGEKAEPDAYRVTVQASVSRYRLDQELNNVGLLIQKLGKPRVAVVVLEQNVEGGAVAGGVVETYLLNALGKKGYALVDRQAMLAVERAAAKGQGDYTDAVVRAAAAGGAEVVVVGQAQARAGSVLSGTSFRPVQATVTGRAVEVDSGELLATATFNQQALNVNPAAAGHEALEKVAVELTDSLNRQMVAAWNQRLTGLKTVRMTVSSVGHKDVKRLQEALKEQLAQVEEVHERGYRDGQLRLDLEISGSTRSFVDELAAFTLGETKLAVKSFSSGTVEVRWGGPAAKGGRKP